MENAEKERILKSIVPTGREIENFKKIPLWLHSKPKLVVKCRGRENKNCHSVPLHSYPRVIENSKTIAKKFKKLGNSTTASFQSKISWKMPRKREYKKYSTVSFLPDAK